MNGGAVVSGGKIFLKTCPHLAHLSAVVANTYNLAEAPVAFAFASSNSG
jgi:hypothetical protein